MKDMLKKLNIIFLCITTLGCSVPQNNEPSYDKTQTSQEVENKIPTFQYPDEMYNNNISKDKTGNYYFLFSQYIYKMDKESHITPVSKRLINNKYLISQCKYYNNYLYLYVTCGNQSEDKGFRIARMNTDGSDFKILFTTEQIYSYPFIYFTDNTINISHAKSGQIILQQYALEEPYSLIKTTDHSIVEDRKNYIEKYYPSYKSASGLETISINHFYKEKIYYVWKNKETYKYNKIVQLDVTTNEVKEYILDDLDDINYIDLIDDHWFIYSKKCIYKYNLDFTKRTTITPTKDVYKYVIEHGKNHLNIKEEKVN